MESLHKFLFIMYFHQLSIRDTFFQSDPGDRTHRWIEAYRARYNLLGEPKHVWLHVLKYFLITPHLEIIELGRKAEEEMIDNSAPNSTMPDSDREWVERWLTMEIDPELDDWKCLGYYNEMQMSLLIWEAAPGEEFVISSNSFGLYEGQTEADEPLHKFFVISPRLVLVLCHAGLIENDNSSEFANIMDTCQLDPDYLSDSMLLSAPHKGATVKYANTKSPPCGSTIHYGNHGGLSPSFRDNFQFEICPLSPKETHTVNGIILGSLQDDGALTFCSRDAVLRTLTEFNRNPEFSAANKGNVVSLTQLLSPTRALQTARALYLAPENPPEGSLWARSFELYQLLKEGTDSDSIRFRQWEEFYLPLWPMGPTPAVPYRPARLVNNMDDSLAGNAFEFSEDLVLRMGPDLRDEGIFGEQLMISFLDHLVRHDRFKLETLEQDLLGPIAGRGERRIMEYTDVRFSLSLDNLDMRLIGVEE